MVPLAASLCAFAVLASVGLAVGWWWRKGGGRDDSRAADEEDDNPVYGVYYFGDGDQKVDNGEIEMVDENEVYGS